MTSSWESKGCYICRRKWEDGTPLPELAVNQERHATLHQCDACGSFWEQFERYVDVISASDVKTYYHI